MGWEGELCVTRAITQEREGEWKRRIKKRNREKKKKGQGTNWALDLNESKENISSYHRIMRVRILSDWKRHRITGFLSWLLPRFLARIYQIRWKCPRVKHPWILRLNWLELNSDYSILCANLSDTHRNFSCTPDFFSSRTDMAAGNTLNTFCASIKSPFGFLFYHTTANRREPQRNAFKLLNRNSFTVGPEDCTP